MNKKTIGIIIGIVVFIVLAVIVLKVVIKPRNSAPLVPEPTPTPAYKQAPDTISVGLKLNKARTNVDMAVENLENEYEGIEYEVTYNSDTGPKGVLSGAKPIPLTEGDSFTRIIELGTCSTGGKCTFHTNTKNSRVIIKLHGKDGEVYILTKDFPEL